MVADGTSILRAMLVLLKEQLPLAFFGWIAAACWAVAIALAVPLAAAGLVLDSIARGRLETKRLAYLVIATTG